MWTIMKKYVENMKEHSLQHRLWNLEKFQDLPLYNIGFGTSKNSELSLSI